MEKNEIFIDFTQSAPKLLVDESEISVSKGLKYHIKREIPIKNSVFYRDSESFSDLINEVKVLYDEKKLILSESDLKFVENYLNPTL